ncbi:MAG: hypothetical protein ACYTDY_02630 [Planctomycetota bacterium]|jgi:hypothetical protein
MEPSEFEAAVLDRVVTRTDDPALRAQLAEARVRERDHTGVGCFSRLDLPYGTPKTDLGDRPHGRVDGPYFESPAVPYGGGTILWLEDGRAHCLEIYSHGGYFPEDHGDLAPFELRDTLKG